MDAVMLGETDLIDNAAEKATAITSSLTSIAKLAGISSTNRAKTNELIDQLKVFSTSAHSVYGKMAAGEEKSEDGKDLSELAGEMSQQTQTHRGQLDKLTQCFSSALKSQLATISDMSGYVHLTV